MIFATFLQQCITKHLLPNILKPIIYKHKKVQNYLNILRKGILQKYFLHKSCTFSEQSLICSEAISFALMQWPIFTLHPPSFPQWKVISTHLIVT